MDSGDGATLNGGGIEPAGFSSMGRILYFPVSTSPSTNWGYRQNSPPLLNAATSALAVDRQTRISFRQWKYNISPEHLANPSLSVGISQKMANDPALPSEGAYEKLRLGTLLIEDIFSRCATKETDEMTKECNESADDRINDLGERRIP